MWTCSKILLLVAGLALFARDSFAEDVLLPEGSRKEIEKLFSGKNIIIHDAELGWTIKPDMVRHGTRLSNAAGMRAWREYAVRPSSGILRAAAYGDSFVYGAGAATEDTWTEKVSSGAPNIEVMNYGVPAYGLDQAWLRFRNEGRKFGASVAIIGLAPDTIFRNLGVFRPFYEPGIGMPFSKPRFLNKKNGLELAPNPLRSAADYDRFFQNQQAAEWVGRDDWFYQKYKSPPSDLAKDLCYKPDCEAARLALLLAKGFAAEVKAGGAAPLLLLFCDRASYEQAAEEGETPYAPLLRSLRKAGLEVLDTSEALMASGAAAPALFSEANHYTPYANELVAGAVRAWLLGKFPGASTAK